jgi:hypothetical protein
MGSGKVATIAELTIGAPQTALNLTMFPLSGNPACSLDYLLVDEALKIKKVVVEEVSETGAVPELRMTNFSSSHVLVIDGTELVGAKQNRIVNASFLIPPESVTKIPVSCVEQGRWRYKGKQFEGSRFHSPHSVRREIHDHQKVSLKARLGHKSDQGKVWARVAEISNRMDAPTETGAINDVYEQRASSLKDYADKIHPKGTETGGAFFIGGRFVGLDLFDRPATFLYLFPKLLMAVAVEAAMEERNRARSPKSAAATKAKLSSVLKEISTSLFEKYEPVGVGEDWRYDGKLSFGKALQYHADLIHFSAFGK